MLRLLKIGKKNRILYLVETKSLASSEEEFLKYKPYDDPGISRDFGVHAEKRLISPTCKFASAPFSACIPF